MAVLSIKQLQLHQATRIKYQASSINWAISLSLNTFGINP
jgi:hypothetical protein